MRRWSSGRSVDRCRMHRASDDRVDRRRVDLRGDMRLWGDKLPGRRNSCCGSRRNFTPTDRMARFGGGPKRRRRPERRRSHAMLTGDRGSRRLRYVLPSW